MKKAPAFTLIETVIAVGVMAIIIVAMASLTVTSLRASAATVNEFIAYHRAEEGLEIVRSVRDSNWLRNFAWNTGLTPGVYKINEAPPWKLVPTTVPDEISLTQGKFRRVIEIEALERSEHQSGALRVKSTVYFNGGGTTRTIFLISELVDWKKGPL
jgi:type II secretory pathway pseudopilin PulG